jgi:hypothetical protein
MHEQPTADEARAEAIAERWRASGLDAAPEMIEAICRRDELLANHARAELEEAREAALPFLTRAAADPRCAGVAEPLAALVCAGDAGWPTLRGMLGASQPAAVSVGLDVVRKVAKAQAKSACAPGAAVLAASVPALSGLLHALSGDALREALWAVASLGARAAPLVPDLIPLLDGEEVASNIAADALGAAGPGAAAAVPALRALLRRGGKWRWRAVSALGGIGAPARPALPDFEPVLAAALPALCGTRPAYSEADVIASAVQSAAVKIGGPAVEPLVPNLAIAFQRMRACQLISGVTDQWLAGFGALGRQGKRAVPVLLSIVVDPAERVDTRQQALDALDRVEPLLTGGPPAGSPQIRAIRAALHRKREVFAPREPSGAAMQIWIPPTPPRTPRTLALCREEAGLPPPAEPPGPAKLPQGTEWWVHDGFGRCVESHLCGPDAATYRATIARCCHDGYGASPPWFCEVP